MADDDEVEVNENTAQEEAREEPAPPASDRAEEAHSRLDEMHARIDKLEKLVLQHRGGHF